MADRQFDTRSVPADSRLEYWADQVCENLTDLQICDVSGNQTDFIGRLTQRSFGPVSIASILAQNHAVQLTRREIAKATEEVMFLHLQRLGGSRLRLAGSEVALRHGDMAMTENTQPHYHSLHAARDKALQELLVVRVPTALLSSQIANIHSLAGAYVAADSTIGSLVSQFISNVWDRRNGIDEQAGDLLGNQIVDLITLAFDNNAIEETPESAVRTGHLIRMKRFIGTRLSDNALSPAMVADAACISPRYAHRLFSNEGITISGYIMNQRLARCEEMLDSAQHRQLRISEIAHMWGFRDASHFGHVFRRKYDMSPSAWRNREK